MRSTTLLSLITLVLIFVLPSCKQNDNASTCPPTVPAVENLQFRLVDKTSGRDLLLDSTKTPYFNPDWITATQPCTSIASAASKHIIYQVPGGGGYKGCCFWFPSLKNPGEYDSTACFQVLLHLDNQDTDTLQWSYYTDLVDRCKPQIMLSVSFNGTVLPGPTYDGAYQYYLLQK